MGEFGGESINKRLATIRDVIGFAGGEICKIVGAIFELQAVEDAEIAANLV